MALIDYDRDGWLDALVLERHAARRTARRSDATWPPGAAPTNRLYRNRHDGTFEDVTDAAGLRRTGVGVERLRRRLRQRRLDRPLRHRTTGGTCSIAIADGRFEDVTAQRRAGRRPGVRWGSGCTFVDYDRDGRLDLFVANYLRFDLADGAGAGRGRELPLEGRPGQLRARRACRPTPTCSIAIAATARSRTSPSASGIAKVTGRYSMTAVTTDLDGDGWPDIYVAVDSTAAILYRNNHDGTFTDVAVESGAAYSENGNAAGRAWASPSATTTATAGSICSRRTSPTTSRRSIATSGRGCSRTWPARRDSASRTATWSGAQGMPDLDNDGRAGPLLRHRQRLSGDRARCCRSIRTGVRALVFRNTGDGRFENVTDASGDAAVAHSSRGAAFGDVDNDGDIDVLVMNMNEPPSLLRNDYARRQRLDRARARRHALQPLRHRRDGRRHRRRARRRRARC